MRNSPLLAPLALALALAGPSAPAAQTPSDEQAEAVLRLALSAPKSAFSGHAIFIRWSGGQSHSQEYNIAFRPPGSYRREYLSPDGSPATLAVSDGSREWLHLIAKDQVLSGEAIKSMEKQLGPDEEERLLRENYGVSLRPQEKVAGREAWVLELRPKLPGKPSQTLMVDKATGALLSNRRFLLGRGTAALSKFTRFEPGPQPEDSFRLPQDTAAATGHDVDPDYMTLAELEQALGGPSGFPARLRGGFTFESADFFPVGGHNVQQARYTDGLAVVSLFQTRKPVHIGSRGRPLDPAPPSPSLRLSSPGHVVRLKSHGRHFTLIGDISPSLLNEIAADLKSN